MNLTLNLISFLGIFALCFVAWLGSEDRRALPVKTIAWGIGLQLVIGLLVFQLPITRQLIVGLGSLFNALIDAADAGARFLFGDLIVPKLGESVGPGAAGR